MGERAVGGGAQACAARAILISFFTAGVGWAPFAIQVSAFSTSMWISDGSVWGL